MNSRAIEFIISCQCGDTPSYAKEMYRVLHKKYPIKLPTDEPKIVVKETEIIRLIEEIKGLPEGGNAVDRIKALRRGKRKYAMFFQLDTNGGIRCMYNLLTGNEVK